MAIDPKTGKPILDNMAAAERLTIELLRCFSSDDIVAEDGALEPLPDVEPRGESVLREAYGPWLAAQEARRLTGGGDV